MDRGGRWRKAVSAPCSSRAGADGPTVGRRAGGGRAARPAAAGDRGRTTLPTRAAPTSSCSTRARPDAYGGTGADARLAGARGPATCRASASSSPAACARPTSTWRSAAAPVRRRRLQRRRARAGRQGPQAAARVLRRRRRRRLLRRCSRMTIETRFGPYGGRYVPETLIPALDELTAAYEEARERRGLPGRARAPPRRLRRPADAALPRRPAQRALRRHDPAQARGPLPHRRPQDQQRPRPGAAGQAHGQDARHRRDRRRPARRGHGHRLRAARPRVRRLHGRRGRAPPGAQRRAHAPARRHGRAGGERLAHAQGRDERGAARLGDATSATPTTSSARSPARRPTPPWCATSRR